MSAALENPVRLILRRLRLERASPLAMLALVGVTCFLFAALPRLLNDFADDGLRFEVAHAAPLARNVRALEWGRIDGGEDPLPAVAARAARLQQTLPKTLRDLIGDRTFLVRSTRYALQTGPSSLPAVGGLSRYLTMRLQSGVSPHVRLVAGRLPADSEVDVRARTEDPVLFGTRIPGLSTTKEVPLLEVALSTTTARLVHAHVGDRALFTPDLTEVAVQRVPLREEQPLAVEVVGLFEIGDPQASFWFGDPTLDTPNMTVAQDLSTTDVYAEALVSPGQYARMLAATRPLLLAYEYRYFVDERRLDAGKLDRLEDDIEALDAHYAGAGALERRFETGLLPVLSGYRAARSEAETLVAVAALGLLACALATVGLLAVLSRDRRRLETHLARTRGVSPRHVLVAQAAEGLAVAAPAGLAGWAAAVLAIDARGSSLSTWLVLAIVGGTVALLVAAIVDAARRPLASHRRDDVDLARPSPRRLVVEAAIAGAAVLGAYLLRRRGLEGSGSDGGGSFDPYLAGVPVLLALAGGILALRLYPVPIAAAARLARRGRGLVLHIGLSRAARQSNLAAAPLLVLLLALAIASFSSVMLSTIRTGQDRTGWRTIGADARVDAPEDQSLPPRVSARLEAVGDVARAYVRDAGLGHESEPTILLALELPAYERLVAGTPAAFRLPRELRTQSPVPGAVPALVSTDWPGGGFFQVDLPEGTVGFVQVAERASFPGVSSETPFAVVPLAALEEAAGGLATSRLYVRGASEAAVRQAVDDEAPRAAMASRSAVAADLRASPLVEGALRAFRSAIVVAALYAGLAVALMVLITARSRTHELALVRTMGGSSRDAVGLTAVELAPFVVIAVLLGIGLGVATPYLISSGLDLAFFTGGESNPIAVSWREAAALAAGVAALVCASVLLVGERARRARLDRVLRIGER